MSSPSDSPTGFPAPPKKFYLTTPIYYVNARPHIGHAYTTIVADVLARRHRLLGDPTFFLTGTDEHGQKIERSAAAAGVPPQQFADQVSASFEALWKRMGITNDRYIRTTDPAHKRGVQQLFTALYERGFIYLASYTGAYCVSDEAFVDVPVGQPCPDCGRVTESVTEENFFFKLSAFQRPLLDLIESGTLKVEPEARRNEVLSFLRGNVASIFSELRDTVASHDSAFVSQSPGKVLAAAYDVDEVSALAEKNPRLARSKSGEPYVPGALKDLSISRSSFTWGVPVPELALRHARAVGKHVIYVWLDALANYMTAVGYGDPSPAGQAEFNRWWPADLHLVGKEIIRFHCVYWPAFLLALDPLLQHDSDEAPPQLSPAKHAEWAAEWLPKTITAHGWLLFDNSKMSKSKGNIVRTETILEAFGEHVYGKQFPASTKQERDLFAADVLRYFLLREIPFGQDGSFSFEAMVTRYNADLANGYGNLVSRTLSMIQQYFEGEIPFGTMDEQLGLGIGLNVSASTNNFAENDFSSLLHNLMNIVAQADGHISATAPWKLAKTPENRNALTNVLYSSAESIRIVNNLISTVIPFSAERIFRQLGIVDPLPSQEARWSGSHIGPLTPIFPRADKSLIQIMTDMENTSHTPAPADLTAVNNAHDTTTPDVSPFPEAPLGSATPQSLSSRPESRRDAVERPAGSAAPTARTTDPAAPPRALDEPSGTLPVAGSQALTTGPTPPSSAPTAPSPEANQITIDDFAKIELRVAEILVAERIPKADKLLRLEVDLGYEKRQILSGIAEWYTPEELVGRRIVVITNLAPRKMRGLESHGMLLAGSADTPATADQPAKPGKPILATMAGDVPLGTRLK